MLKIRVIHRFLPLILSPLLLLCAGTLLAGGNNSSAIAEPVEGSDLKKIILTPKAVERLDLQTVEIAAEGKEKGHKTVPYSAIIYDSNGKTWVYANINPLTFMRREITVDKISGDKAFLSDGPEVGTSIVSVGVIELYGFETGIGK